MVSVEYEVLSSITRTHMKNPAEMTSHKSGKGLAGRKAGLKEGDKERWGEGGKKALCMCMKLPKNKQNRTHVKYKSQVSSTVGRWRQGDLSGSVAGQSALYGKLGTNQNLCH